MLSNVSFQLRVFVETAHRFFIAPLPFFVASIGESVLQDTKLAGSVQIQNAQEAVEAVVAHAHVIHEYDLCMKIRSFLETKPE